MENSSKHDICSRFYNMVFDNFLDTYGRSRQSEILIKFWKPKFCSLYTSFFSSIILFVEIQDRKLGHAAQDSFYYIISEVFFLFPYLFSLSLFYFAVFFMKTLYKSYYWTQQGDDKGKNFKWIVEYISFNFL